MLHVLNGDAVRGALDDSHIGGDVAVWADPLYEGPVPLGVSDAEFARTRARFHSGEHFSPESALAMHESWDAALARAAHTDEVVLWFEHDLHDQLLLARHLDWLPRHAPNVPVSIICIDRFPGVEPFYGVGQLDGSQLASLFPARRRVSAEQFTLGRRAWDAFIGSDPREIESVLAGDTASLPFLATALVRLLEDFPDAENGLPRTERTVLEILAAHETLTFIELFPLQQCIEEAPFMGDLTLWARIVALASGDRPLLTIERDDSARDFGRARLTITADGRRALDCTLDWMTVAHLDRWIGGTHIFGTSAPWRWDRTTRRLVHTR